MDMHLCCYSDTADGAAVAVVAGGGVGAVAAGSEVEDTAIAADTA